MTVLSRLPTTARLLLVLLTGLLATFVMSLWQVLGGAPRAELFTNAIVLADIVMVLMVLLVFCRPSRRWSLVILGMAAGCGTIVLTGSRGVFAALLALLVVLAVASPSMTTKTRRNRHGQEAMNRTKGRRGTLPTTAGRRQNI